VEVHEKLNWYYRIASSLFLLSLSWLISDHLFNFKYTAKDRQ
jgi:p-aminobenzoyl-glutamate transporter AbgT